MTDKACVLTQGFLGVQCLLRNELVSKTCLIESDTPITAGQKHLGTASLDGGRAPPS